MVEILLYIGYSILHRKVEAEYGQRMEQRQARTYLNSRSLGAGLNSSAIQ